MVIVGSFACAGTSGVKKNPLSCLPNNTLSSALANDYETRIGVFLNSHPYKHSLNTLSGLCVLLFLAGSLSTCVRVFGVNAVVGKVMSMGVRGSVLFSENCHICALFELPVRCLWVMRTAELLTVNSVLSRLQVLMPTVELSCLMSGCKWAHVLHLICSSHSGRRSLCYFMHVGSGGRTRLEIASC